jgi:hypothetical protein
MQVVLVGMSFLLLCLEEERVVWCFSAMSKKQLVF